MGADWTLHPWHHNNVGGVTEGSCDTTQVMLGVSLQARCDTALVCVNMLSPEQLTQCISLQALSTTFSNMTWSDQSSYKSNCVAKAVEN